MLEVMKAEAEALAGSTSDTAALAERVSRKVRTLSSHWGAARACEAARLPCTGWPHNPSITPCPHPPCLLAPSQVRELDTAQSRVQATLGHISLVLDRMHAVEGIQSALAREDFEAAAECVARYLELEDELGAAAGGEGGAAAAVAAVAAAATDADSRQAAEQAKVCTGWWGEDWCCRLVYVLSCPPLIFERHGAQPCSHSGAICNCPHPPLLHHARYYWRGAPSWRASCAAGARQRHQRATTPMCCATRGSHARCACSRRCEAGCWDWGGPERVQTVVD